MERGNQGCGVLLPPHSRVSGPSQDQRSCSEREDEVSVILLQCMILAPVHPSFILLAVDKAGG